VPVPVELPLAGFWVLLVVMCFLVETWCTLLLCAEAIFRVWVFALLVELAVLPVLMPVSADPPGITVLPVVGAAGWVEGAVCASTGSAANASAPARSRLRVVSVLVMALGDPVGLCVSGARHALKTHAARATFRGKPMMLLRPNCVPGLTAM
jgi:hypothetical protein